MKQTKHLAYEDDYGFSLLECVIAIFITTVGLLAVAGLATVALQTERFTYDSAEASQLAISKVEEIKGGVLTNGGSLTANISGYFDSPNSKYFRRWQISDGFAGTKQISIVTVPQSAALKVRTTQIDTLVR